MFKVGDIVEILPEFQDEGDNEFTWVFVGDEEKGRVDIKPSDIDMAVKPIYTVRAEWIKPAGPKS